MGRSPIKFDRGSVRIIANFQKKDAILAPPPVNNSTLFIGSLDNYLYALDIDSMNPKWLFQINGPIVTTSTFQKNTVFVTSGDGYCYALKCENGGQIWKMKIAESIFSWPVYSEEKIVFGTSDSSLHALRSSDGTLLWKFKTNDHIKARPAIEADKVFVGSWDLYFYFLSRNSGDLIWKQKISDNLYFPATTSNPITQDGTVFVVSYVHVVHAFQTSNGNLMWSHPSNEWNKPEYSSPVVNGKYNLFWIAHWPFIHP